MPPAPDAPPRPAPLAPRPADRRGRDLVAPHPGERGVPQPYPQRPSATPWGRGSSPSFSAHTGLRRDHVPRSAATPSFPRPLQVLTPFAPKLPEGLGPRGSRGVPGPSRPAPSAVPRSSLPAARASSVETGEPRLRRSGGAPGRNGVGGPDEGKGVAKRAVGFGRAGRCLGTRAANESSAQADLHWSGGGPPGPREQEPRLGRQSKSGRERSRAPERRGDSLQTGAAHSGPSPEPHSDRWGQQLGSPFDSGSFRPKLRSPS